MPVVTKAQPNWTVESVDAPGQVWGKDMKPVHVQAVIAGYATPAAQRTVSLVVSGKTTATKTVRSRPTDAPRSISPRSKCPMASAAARSESTPPTAFPADDLRRFAVERSDPQKVLLIHNYGDNRSPLLYRRRALGGRAIGLYP